MKTRVNLYSEEVRPRLELLTLNFALFCWLVSLLLLAGIAGYIYMQKPSLQQQLMALQDTQTQKSGQLEQLSARVSVRKQDASLVAELEQQQAQLDQQQTLLNALQQQENLKSRGFSPLLLALAERHEPQLALHKIIIQGADVRFEGQLLASDALPRWLEQLSDDSYFQHTRFNDARLFRDDQHNLHFVLDSKAASSESALGAQP